MSKAKKICVMVTMDSEGKVQLDYDEGVGLAVVQHVLEAGRAELSTRMIGEQFVANYPAGGKCWPPEKAAGEEVEAPDDQFAPA